MSSSNPLHADYAWPLYDNLPVTDAFHLDTSHSLDNAVATRVTQPWLFGFKPNPTHRTNRSILILGGGGYIELMVGREGIQVARWLSNLGFTAFVLIHRFPTAETGSQAPLDDARRALQLIDEKGFGGEGIGVCGLSSGGHLAASLLCAYPAVWRRNKSSEEEEVGIPKLRFAIIGYAPICTNAAGRQVISNKPALLPREKQELYDVVQPDVQLESGAAAPVFIVYAGNDGVVPVVNAYRLAEGMVRVGGSVEVHVFADAPHGFAVDTVGLPVSGWMGMCERWLRQGGFLG
ncbi:alpha/beta-hydrolase [Decorospora gaudefroyi]|uniref:Alpha/beta-hydrolase n=1 Tax=Decorospora gaudefroyi TaxID=184978 RepID=A0A6A5KHE1_9PLEO|nr:alpha/beta-hydrolase [Decorospora gaudefroyi]